MIPSFCRNLGLYITTEQLPQQVLPLSLENGFSTKNSYLGLGASSISESGEAYFIL
ncbi:MAG: hypothetical protein ACR2LT_06300 [Pyrinomonadaceae bacterium]